MDYDVITEIELIFQDYLEAGVEVHLHEILWSIDSKYKIVPSLTELNEAMKTIKKVEILREGKSVEFSSSNKDSSDLLTATDLNNAMDIYEKKISELKKKSE